MSVSIVNITKSLYDRIDELSKEEVGLGDFYYYPMLFMSDLLFVL